MSEVKVADENSLDSIAVCHRAAFATSLSTALGLKYVKVMLRWYLSNDNTFLFYVTDQDRCVGYCGGMVKVVWGVGSASSMAQYSFNAAVKSFLTRPWLVFHQEIRAKFPFIIKNFFNRFARRKALLGDPKVIFEPYAGLVVIGVDPFFQGRGYGSLLLKEFENITRQRGLKKMVLSVRSDNVQAIKAYIQNGWGVVNAKGNSTSMEKLLS